MLKKPMKSALLCLAMSATLGSNAALADETSELALSRLKTMPEILAIMDPAIRVVWHDNPAPAVAEATPPIRYSTTSVSVIPFVAGHTHCETAFRRGIEEMLAEARKGGYDVVYDVRPALRDGPASDLNRVTCTLSPVTARVNLSARLGMSAAARARADSIELESERLAAVTNRPAAKGALFIPLEPILASEEFKSLLASTGFYLASKEPPPYTVRFGPVTYSETIEAGDLAPLDTCRKAVLATLRSMINDARRQNYNTVIRVRSVLDGQFAPSPGDAECAMGNRSARAQLRAILIQRQ